jgi:hypothetical protein
MTDSMQDLSFRPELAPSKSSPAGNNFRSTSTPVNYHRRSPNSFMRSTSKSHTPSPLYYDYTEAFNIEEAVAGEGIARNTTFPIPFIFNKTINERRGIVLGVSPQYDSSSKGSSVSVDLRTLVKLSSADSSEEKPRLNSEDSQRERSTNITQDIIPSYLDRRPYERIMADTFDNRDSLKSSQFAKNLEVSLQSKSDTSNSSSPILLDTDDWANHDLDISQSPEDDGSLDQTNGTAKMSASNRTSSFRLSTYLPIFPKPPDRIPKTITDGDSTTLQEAPARLPLDAISIQKPRKAPIQAVKEGLGVGHHNLMTRTPRHEQDLQTGSIQYSATTPDRRIRSSRYYSIDHGLSDLAQLISNFEFANGSFMAQDVNMQFAEIGTSLSAQSSSALPAFRMPEESSVLPMKALLQFSPPLEPRTPMTGFRSDGDLRTSSSKTLKTNNYALHQEFINSDIYGKERGEIATNNNHANHPITKRPLSRSELSLLAPKAVSPTRVLRLKNNVSQLMKALPPVPQYSKFETSPPQRSSLRRLSPISPQVDLEQKRATADREPTPLQATSFQLTPAQQDLEDALDLEQPISSPKFRIKSRFFDAQRSYSPANSHPWNLDENYPWYGQQPTIRLSSLRSMNPGTQKGPKFKLRVTRASVSPSDTMKISPEAGSSLDLRSPKDLFTPSTNLSGIFRQVGRQFSSRKSSVVLERAPGNGTQASCTVLGSAQINGNYEPNPNLLGPPSSTLAYPTSPTEVRSFFSEDNSQIKGHNSLRKRISDLRARIPSPYTSRSATNFSDNEAWRGHITSYAPGKGRLRAKINSEQEDEYGMPIVSLRHQKLGSKVSRWFKDAGLAMRRRVKLHNGVDIHCIPYR